MKKIVTLGSLALLLSFPLSYAFSATITSGSPDWVPFGVGPSTGAWALPSDIPGCGSENELACEPTGDFFVSSPFVGIFGAGVYFTITDNNGVSDIITMANTGGGNGEIQFFSDPNHGILVPPAGYFNGGTLCDEGGAGCSGTLAITTADGTVFTVSPAADGEAGFDPFGFGFDSSDQIQFNGLTPTVPEPSSLLLLGTGLLVGAGFLRRKKLLR